MKKNSFIFVYFVFFAALFGALISSEVCAAPPAGLSAAESGKQSVLYQRKTGSAKTSTSAFGVSGEMRTDVISAGLLLPRYGFRSSYPDSSIENKRTDSKGLLLKAQFKISYLLLNASYEHASHTSDYSGLLPTPELPAYNGKLDAESTRVHYTMGFSYVFSKRLHLVLPYTGASYHKYLFESPLPVNRVNQLYEWFAVPAGMRIYFQLFNNFVIGLDASYLFVVNPRMQIFTQKLLPGVYPYIEDDANIYLKRTWKNFRIEAPVEIFIAKYVGITVTPWFESVKFAAIRPYDLPVEYAEVDDDYYAPSAFAKVHASLRRFTSSGVICSANLYFDFQ